MNPVDADIFDDLARRILDKYPNAYVANEAVINPPAFPAVFIEEVTDITDTERLDSSQIEKESIVTYSVDVTHPSEQNGKSTCDEIVSIVSKRMNEFNMTRIMCSKIQNFADPSIYRKTARFIGEISNTGVCYRR